MTPIVFDFDGTLCRLFQNYDLKQTSVILKQKMLELGVMFSESNDAFDVFDVIAKQIKATEAKKLAFRIADGVLTSAEAEALEKCEYISGVTEVFSALAQDEEYSVGIATNNSVSCVKAFLDSICPGCHVPVVGRIPDRPERMKPSPWPLQRVARDMNVQIGDVIFVGDTINDYMCSQSAGCMMLGMAATNNKRVELSQFLAPDMIVSDFFALLNKVDEIKSNMQE